MSGIEVRLVRGPIAGERLAAPPAAPASAGGECVFIGRTRAERHPDLGPLRALEYEAHESMALRTIEAIARDAMARFACESVQVLHSVGRVRVGEASVSVRVMARGREEAFAACRQIIDRLKAEAPIWKREVWERGATWQQGVAAAAPGLAEGGR